MNSNLKHHLQANNNESTTNLVNYQSNIYPEELLEEAAGLDLKEFINILKCRKKQVLAVAFITLLLALLITLLIQPVYRAYSTIKVERYAANANVQILNAESSRSDRDYFETQIQLIQTKTLANKVITELGLDRKAENEGFISKFKNFFSSKLPTQSDEQKSLEELFLKNLSVKPVGNSQLLSISYDSSDPQLAAEINNAVAKTFVRQNLERRFESASSYKNYINDNIKVTQKSLENVTQRLNTYAKENNIVQDIDGKSTNSHILQKYAEELVIAKKESIEAKAAYELYRNNPNIDPSAFIDDPYVLSLKKATARLETKFQARKYKKNRSARRLRREIDDLKKQIKTESDSIKSSFKTRFMKAEQKEKMLHVQLNKLEQSALSSQSKNTQYNRLLREVEINQLAYNKQLEQLMAVNLASNVGTNNISIIDKATTPTKKHKPSFKTNLPLGLLFGLLLGAGIAFLREFIDDSIKNSDSLEKITGLPVLSQLPNLKGLNQKKLALQTAMQPRSPLAEAIRSLQTSIRFSSRNGAPQSIFITGSGEDEGKSTLAINLATAYSQAGNRVLLIDADLRSPTIHKLLDMQNLVGLSNYLANKDEPAKDIGQPSMIQQLNVITSGPSSPDPVELLSSNKMIELLELVSKEYDQVIIDGPPILGLADSLILANMADSTIITVEAGKTRKTDLLDSLKRLERANVNMLGSVLTRISRSVNPEYNQKYYSYSSDKKAE